MGFDFLFLKRLFLKFETGVYVQKLDDLVVCTGKFVDSVLNCSGGGNVVWVV